MPHLDFDEFIDLPDGRSTYDLVDDLEREGRGTFYGTIASAYAEKSNDMRPLPDDPQASLEEPWCFDAVPHLVKLPFEPPLETSGGTRGQLTARPDPSHKPPPLG